MFYPILAGCLGFLLAATALPAAEITAVRTAEPPKIDGLLADPAWKSAVPVTDFLMVEPRPGDEPTERTEVRILYDDANLYIGVFCFDAEPGRISANTMAHDSAESVQRMGFGRPPAAAAEDLVRILLDPFQDRRTAYVFIVNPLGARSEGLAFAGSASLNWDGIWEARSRILDNGWSAEIRIPFKSISFKPGLSAWGINIERTIPRKQETIRLSGTTADSNFNNPGDAAVLAGIEGIRQGLGITFKPYGLTAVRRSGPENRPASWEIDGGFDLYKSITPNLAGVVSYNMDFAETEADERRINLTRFPLFFPEKRMFFLEGSEVFSFSSSISFTPFFSRKIGLVQGAPVPVLYGAKIYGKIGDTNLAALNVRTGESGDLPGRNLLAARMTRNIFAQSRIGWIFTNGSPTGERNALAGADFNYTSSEFLGNKNLLLAAWAAYNWNERDEGRHHGFGFRADYPNDLLNIQSTYAYYGEALDPGLGFMMRRGIQTGYARIGYRPRPADGFLGRFVRQFFFSTSADLYWDLAGNLETRRLDVSPLSFRTESGEQIETKITANRDILPFDFEVARGVVLPAGPYDFTNFEFGFTTSRHRPASFEAEVKFGGFYSGRYDDIKLGLTLKPSGYLMLGFDTNMVRGRLPEGRFSENVTQIKVDLFLSPDFGFMNYIQYDDISRRLGWNARLRWQISPGNEIYLVYNTNWERRWDPARRFHPLEGRGVLKISLSIRP
ncbi:MAG: carbohydrate binding family 9 domain-containing protein [Acidobacteriota bacterium]|nr:carbohydrate binding family 9 domain-containing protein [Acidobacteriota bacterium]